jgi:hypothetical protein
MRRIATGLPLALFLFGCGSPNPLSDRVELLTGIEACFAGGQQPSYAGVLVPDPEFGTRIEGKGPVMWPVGYTGRRLPAGEIQVLNTSAEVVATTGRAYAISPAPQQGEEAQELLERVGAIAAPDCYDWDIEEVPPRPAD